MDSKATRYRVGILETHPIQYKAPLFRHLHGLGCLDLTVFYCMLPDPRVQGAGFGVDFAWDVPLLDGYPYAVLRNRARQPTTSRFGGCDTPEIAEVVRGGGFDAFLANGWGVKSAWQLVSACRRYRVPCMVRGEANALRPRAWWKRAVHRALLRRYAACLAIGKANRDYYLQQGVPSGRIFWAPYAVDNDRFGRASAAVACDRGGWRQRWGIPPEALCFLFSGKLSEKKRPMDLLRALDRLHAVAPGVGGGGVSVLLVGDGELRGECERFARARGLPVHFAGFLNQGEIPAAYAAADCLVLPSDHGETWGLVVNEAMACGLPAIVSDQVGCQADLVEEGRTGFVVPCGDVEALTAAMRRMSLDRGACRRMGAEARERVATYGYSAVAHGLLQALNTVCGGTRP